MKWGWRHLPLAWIPVENVAAHLGGDRHTDDQVAVFLHPGSNTT